MTCSTDITDATLLEGFMTGTAIEHVTGVRDIEECYTYCSYPQCVGVMLTEYNMCSVLSSVDYVGFESFSYQIAICLYSE